MFQVSEKASEMIKEHFMDREKVPSIRIILSQGGWSGPSLGMALDEPQEDDQVFDESGITYIVNKQLFEQVKPIQIDFVKNDRGSGYRISANLAKVRGSCSCWSEKMGPPPHLDQQSNPPPGSFGL